MGQTRPHQENMIFRTILTQCCLLLSMSAIGQPLKVSPATFSDLKGWNEASILSARPAILKSCQTVTRTSDHSSVLLGDPSVWKTLCHHLTTLPESEIKAFIETHFKVVRINKKDPGLFTGYYTPVYEGRLTRQPGFETPLLKRPSKHSKINITDSRQVIEQKVYDRKIWPEEAILWLANPVDAFFLQIQGSGNVRLSNGDIVHVGYAGNNGYNYTSIGLVLKKQGSLKEVSMQSIRQWIYENPEKQSALFNQNARYVFFRITSKGAVTAQGVSATAQHTLAVDPDYIPLGTLLWLDTTLTASQKPFRKMVVAQDTGSAIKGMVRGDIYMGVGSEAAVLAGSQQEPGALFALIPRDQPAKKDKLKKENQ